ncbi:MAG: DoxX family protein [Paludibacter sp.]|nr:DoxX family protein [Paludibacter sp.]
MRRKSKYRTSRSSSNLMGVNSVLLHMSRLLMGAVFVFSGFVKAVDPLGTIYKIEDYLTAFGGFFSEILFIAYPAAFILILVELLIGLNLVFQVRFRLTAWVGFVFMLAVTPLTLYIALKNPVSDCGCFGDAVKLSNWQTFYKNVVLFVLALILVILNKKFQKVYLPHIEWVMMIVFAVSGLGFMIYSLIHLPVLDFRPYKIGVNISEAMQIPQGAPADVYKYNFIYEKNGVRKNFSDPNHLPDSTWTFISQETMLVSEGYRPPIHDFSILTAEFEDKTNEILSYEGTTYLIIMYDLAKSSEKGIEKIKIFVEEKQINEGVKVYALTASSTHEIQDFKTKYGLNFPFYKTDPVTLKTMIRANPGVMQLVNGTIKGKWNGRML